MIPRDAFPRLTDRNHRVTSPETADCNCVVWAAGEVDRWWQPGVFWPAPTPPGEYGPEVLKQAFAGLGYELCAGTDLEVGFVKVALYGTPLFYTHAARQLPSGKWTSKLGRAEDIEHDTAQDIAGGVYGAVLCMMKRPTPQEP